MALTDTFLRNYKPQGTDKKQADGDGLFVLLKANGGKWWRFSYRYGGKQKTLSMGVYPDIGLKDARERREAAKKLLAQGIDPGEQRKTAKAASQERAANNFRALGREWFDVWSNGISPGTAARAWANLERNVFPLLGDTPVADIAAKTILPVLRQMEARGVSNTVEKASTYISRIMRYAVQKGYAERDPVPDLRGALKKTTVKHFAAITAPLEVGKLLRDIDGYQGLPEVVGALRLAPLVFVRIGELREARWSDIDFDRAEWRYTASKTGTAHSVPLSRQAVAILESMRPISGEDKTGLVFPGRVKGKPLSDATINRALQRMGYDTGAQMTGHGFRAMARTLLAEELEFPPEWIEHQLAHSVPDALGTAYNRTKYLKQRREMMQAWADYLDRLKTGADVIPLRA
ncbi:integrase [Betaproteobacteria bacterium]|nr:integrase [Betaproteobacteria bacterium]